MLVARPARPGQAADITGPVANVDRLHNQILGDLGRDMLVAGPGRARSSSRYSRVQLLTLIRGPLSDTSHLRIFGKGRSRTEIARNTGRSTVGTTSKGHGARCNMRVGV